MRVSSLRQWFDSTGFAAHLSLPLFRNAYALTASSVSTSVLGTAYWIVAARTYSVEAVGLNTAALAAMLFLGQSAQLNLVNFLNRFVPEAGKATFRLVFAAFAIAVVTSAVLAVGFMAGVSLWAPEMGYFAGSPLLMGWFIIATVIWSIFSLQDGVLIGLRKGTWVLTKNLMFSVAKIVILVALVVVLPGVGIFVSWTATALVISFVVAIILFAYAIPQHARRVRENNARILWSRMVKFAVGDYIASLLWFAAISLLPLLVLSRAGSAANAYFYQAWTITIALYLLNGYFRMALITEGVKNPQALPQQSYRLFIQASRLLIPVVIAVFLAAPYILALFGPEYAAEGTTVLRLLVLSVVPDIVIAVYTSVLRVNARMVTLVMISAAVAFPGLIASYVLLDVFGITGVGIAWLGTQSMLAIILLSTELRRLWAPDLRNRPIV